MVEETPITISQMIEKLDEWQKARNDDFNANIAGRTYLENTVSAAAIRGLVDDMSFIMAWCKTLANRVLEMEAKNK